MWFCRWEILTVSHHSAKFDSHTLCGSVNVANHENYNELLWYDDLTLPCDQREVWVDAGYWAIICVSDG